MFATWLFPSTKRHKQCDQHVKQTNIPASPAAEMCKRSRADELQMHNDAEPGEKRNGERAETEMEKMLGGK